MDLEGVDDEYEEAIDGLERALMDLGESSLRGSQRIAHEMGLWVWPTLLLKSEA